MTDTQEITHFLDYWRVIRSRKEIVIAIFLSVVIAGAVVTCYTPRLYAASAKIQVMKDLPDLPFYQLYQQSPWLRYDPIWLRTQFEIIQSSPIVEETITRLNLNEKLGRAYGYLETEGEKGSTKTFKRVSKSMRVRQYRDTNLIEVQIRMSRPDETVTKDVADIANTIVEVYRDQTQKKNRDIKEAALKAMADELEEQKKVVAACESLLVDIREKYGITLLASKMGTDSSLDKQPLGMLQEMRLNARLEKDGKKTKLDKLVSMSPEDRMNSILLLVKDESFGMLMNDKRKAEVELSRLSNLGAKHPDVVKANEGIKEIQAKLNEALNGLMEGIKADYEIAKKKFDIIEEWFDQMKKGQISAEGGGYLEFDRAKEELEHARKIRDDLQFRLISERIELRLPRTTVDIVERAKPQDPNDFIQPNYAVNIILSIVLGLIFGVSLAYFLEYMDTSIKTIDEIERIMGVAVIGVMPQKIRPLNDQRASVAHGEAYRLLRTNILFSKKLNNGKTLCITSGSVGEGKSLTLFNLAFTCAQQGDRVLVVDSDLHRPRQHKMFGVKNDKGLANVLVGEAKLEDAIVATQITNLDLLPSGRINASVHGLLNSAMMKELLAILKESYDFVFFDTPPAIGVSDASLLIRGMSGVILVVQHRKYPRAVSIRAKDMINNIGGNLIGVVLNNINISKDYSSYYFQQHYNYYPSRK